MSRFLWFTVYINFISPHKQHKIQYTTHCRAIA